MLVLVFLANHVIWNQLSTLVTSSSISLSLHQNCNTPSPPPFFLLTWMFSLMHYLFHPHYSEKCYGFSGISLKSQELTAIFLAVRLYCSFVMEYDIHTVLDLATLATTLWVIYMIRFKLKSSYMEDKDNFALYYVVRFCFFFFFNSFFTIFGRNCLTGFYHHPHCCSFCHYYHQLFLIRSNIKNKEKTSSQLILLIIVILNQQGFLIAICVQD